MDKVKKRFTSGRSFEPGEIFDFSEIRNRDRLVSQQYIIPYNDKVYTCQCGKLFDKNAYDAHIQQNKGHIYEESRNDVREMHPKKKG